MRISNIVSSQGKGLGRIEDPFSTGAQRMLRCGFRALTCACTKMELFGSSTSSPNPVSGRSAREALVPSLVRWQIGVKGTTLDSDAGFVASGRIGREHTHCLRATRRKSIPQCHPDLWREGKGSTCASRGMSAPSAFLFLCNIAILYHTKRSRASSHLVLAIVRILRGACCNLFRPSTNTRSRRCSPLMARRKRTHSRQLLDDVGKSAQDDAAAISPDTDSSMV